MFRTFRYVGKTLVGAPEFRARPITSLCRLSAWTVRRRLGHPNSVMLYGSETTRIVLPESVWAVYVLNNPRPLDPELAWLKEKLLPSMVAIDVGAHLGTWTLTMAEAVGPNGQVLAFEPAKSTAVLLRESLRINGFDQVVLSNAAVTDEGGEGVLYHHPKDSRMHSLLNWEGTSEAIDLVTIDESVHRFNLHRVDVMKIDAEGNDERVARGAVNTILAHHPVVIFEVNRLRAKSLGLEAGGTWRFLKDRGYEMHVARSDRTLERLDDAVDLDATNAHWNVVAIHPVSPIQS